MNFFIVDAFADHPFGGNTAGVVLLPAGASFPADALMQDIAAELRYSETAFMLNESGVLHIRYFTPAGEVPLCGHATIATLGVLRHKGLITDGRIYPIRTTAGELEVEAGPIVMMQMAAPQLISTLDGKTTAQLCRIMGIGTNNEGIPAQIVSTGLADIMLPIGSIEQLQTLHPDFTALRALSETLGVVGVHAYAMVNDSHTAHVRNFAPRYDIDEESATGTANAALTYHLFLNDLISAPEHCTFLQGEAMGRPSIINTTLSHSNGHCDIRVGGPYYVVAKGDLRL
ncbi:MAG: PhzF family phenazine biosynthesis protein [Bacteroidales bacterium]|nr:PhzF family phenazine biosynthesis protein [Bacteroidales bacterium]